MQGLLPQFLSDKEIMQGFLRLITEKAQNEAVALLFFIGGVLIGIISVLIILVFLPDIIVKKKGEASASSDEKEGNKE